MLFLLLNYIQGIAQSIPESAKKEFKQIDSLAQQSYNKGDYASTIKYLNQGLELASIHYKKEDSTYISYLTELGGIHRNIAQYEQGEKYLLDAAQLASKAMGKKSIFYAKIQNSLAMLYNQTGRYKESEALFNEVLVTQAALLGKESSDYATTLNNIASVYADKSDFDKAIGLFEQAIAIRGRVLGKDHRLYAEAVNNLAGVYKNMGDLQHAEPLYLESKNSLAKSVGKKHPTYAGIINNLAYVYLEMEHYEQAEPLFLEALGIWEEGLGKNHPYYATGITNMGLLYARKKDYKRATGYFEEANAVRGKIYGKEHPEYATSLNNLSAVYVDAKDYKRAEELLLQTLAIRTKVFGKKHPIYASTLNNLAHVYNKSNQFERAIPLYLESIAVKQNIFGNDHPEIASTINSFAVAHETRNKLEDALKYALMALDAISADWTAADIQYPACLKKIPTLSVNSKSALLSILNTIRAIEKKHFMATKELPHLEQSYFICKLSLELNEKYRQEFSTEEDKLYFLTTSVGIINEGIKLAAQLDELSEQKNYHIDAFAIAEQNKSVVLTSALKAQRARSFGDLPDSLSSQEQALQKELSALKKKLLDAKDETQKAKFRTELNETNIKIEHFKKELEAKFPKYFKTKYESITATALDIQKILDPQTALLEYFVSDSALYVFCITTDTIELVKLNIPKDALKVKIGIFRKTLSDYSYITAKPEEVWTKYTDMGYWFYKEIIEPAIKPLAGTKQGAGKSIEHLVVIPDGELGHLPFEAFLMEPTPTTQKKIDIDYKKLHYLIQDYRISYNYSATLFKENINYPHSISNGKVLGVAASYDKTFAPSPTRSSSLNMLRKELKPLPAVESEVRMLEELFDGTFLYDKKANEHEFKSLAAEHDIFHLAMHGILNPKSPILSGMAFTENHDSLEDNFLQAYEISTMTLNANLIVLSACETGYGKFQQGEGVLSLARSFMYAGVPSLVVSLWQVNDGSTAILMKEFYNNLAKGMTKDAALREAKLFYIKNAQGVLAHPAFWSPFIQLGDNRAITLQTKGGYLIWGIGLGLLALAVGSFLLLRKRTA